MRWNSFFNSKVGYLACIWWNSSAGHPTSNNLSPEVWSQFCRLSAVVAAFAGSTLWLRNIRNGRLPFTCILTIPQSIPLLFDVGPMLEARHSWIHSLKTTLLLFALYRMKNEGTLTNYLFRRFVRVDSKDNYPRPLISDRIPESLLVWYKWVLVSFLHAGSMCNFMNSQCYQGRMYENSSFRLSACPHEAHFEFQSYG